MHDAPSLSENPGEEQAEPQSSLPFEQVEAPQPPRPEQELEETIGYHFKNPEYLKTALIHKSFLHAVPDFYLGSNERLEFLGDSVLGLIASSDLFASDPSHSEGQLTALRGALVRKDTLAELAVPLSLGDYLYMSRGEEAAGGRNRPGNLAHAVEAILGAVYLDGGLQAAADVWHRVLGERDDERLRNVLRGDYKSRLQQLTQATLKLTPAYQLLGTSGPEHSKEFEVAVLVGDRVLASGQGRNKQLAEQKAAQAALSMLLEDEGVVSQLREDADSDH